MQRKTNLVAIVDDDHSMGDNFSSLQSFLQCTASTFAAVPSPTPMDRLSLESAAFMQDQIRMTPRLSLSLGFRYEGKRLQWERGNQDYFGGRN
jgi:hypothetical protein